MNEYSHSEENLRVVDTGKSRYKIVRDGRGLWSIEVDTGQIPVALRNKRYTRHSFALQDIKAYLAGAPEREIIYKKPKKD